MTNDQQQAEPYDYHEQYHSINTGVHRKGGVRLVTPTLTHHLGLWYPPISSRKSQLSVIRFGPKVDAYVRAHFTAMRDCDDFESNFKFTVDDDEVIGLFGHAYKICADGSFAPYDAKSQSIHFGLKDAIESDSRILFMKAHWYGLDVIVRCEFRSEYATITRFVTLVDASAVHPHIAELGNAPEILLSLGRGERRTNAEVRASHAALYKSVWDVLDRDLFRCENIFRPSDEPDRCQIFADFRGIVVAGCDDPSDGTISLENPVTSDKPFDDHWPRERLIPSLWPFLIMRDGLDLEHREFTASFMLGKRAVYITALGPQPITDSSQHCSPLHYLLVARPVNDWQLGALVDRLHFLGTVRLAALMELKALREAGANLRDMEREAEIARRAIDEERTKIALEHYKLAMALIAHKRDGKPIFWAGVQFRVERSRYYVERFEEFVEFLGIDPIDGYPPYHHFVRARLGGVYDYIDRLGHRQERAVRSAANIFELIALAQAAETNRQIAEANKQSMKANEESAKANAMSLQANLESAEANRRNSLISRTIEKLQTKAELALVAVILPHYIIEIIKELDERSKHDDQTIWREDVSILIVGGTFAILSLLVYILDREKKFDREWLKKAALKYVVAALMSLVLVLFFIRR